MYEVATARGRPKGVLKNGDEPSTAGAACRSRRSRVLVVRYKFRPAQALCSPPPPG